MRRQPKIKWNLSQTPQISSWFSYVLFNLTYKFVIQHYDEPIVRSYLSLDLDHHYPFGNWWPTASAFPGIIHSGYTKAKLMALRWIPSTKLPGTAFSCQATNFVRRSRECLLAVRTVNRLFVLFTVTRVTDCFKYRRLHCDLWQLVTMFTYIPLEIIPFSRDSFSMKNAKLSSFTSASFCCLLLWSRYLPWSSMKLVIRLTRLSYIWQWNHLFSSKLEV